MVLYNSRWPRLLDLLSLQVLDGFPLPTLPTCICSRNGWSSTLKLRRASSRVRSWLKIWPAKLWLWWWNWIMGIPHILSILFIYICVCIMETDVHTQQSYGWYFILGVYHIFINTPLETLVFGAERFGVPFRREDRLRSYLIQEGRLVSYFGRRVTLPTSWCSISVSQSLYLVCISYAHLKIKKLHNCKECVQMTDI